MKFHDVRSVVFEWLLLVHLNVHLIVFGQHRVRKVRVGSEMEVQRVALKGRNQNQIFEKTRTGGLLCTSDVMSTRYLRTGSSYS